METFLFYYGLYNYLGHRSSVGWGGVCVSFYELHLMGFLSRRFGATTSSLSFHGPEHEFILFLAILKCFLFRFCVNFISNRIGRGGRGEGGSESNRSHSGTSLLDSAVSVWTSLRGQQDGEVLFHETLSPFLLRPQRNLFYMCEICRTCRMFCGWWDPPNGSVFPHDVTGSFISVMTANHPDSCENFSPTGLPPLHPPSS